MIFHTVVLGRLKKIFRNENEFAIIFHGSKHEMKPEEFDFDISKYDNDFGKAMYFGLEYDQARKWAARGGNGIVNYYLLPIDEIFNDPDTKVLLLRDQLEWLDTILTFLDDPDSQIADIIIGDMMDGRTGPIIRNYIKIASSRGVKMVDLDLETKVDMIHELKPDVFNQQIAVKTKEGLKHVKFIGSMEVSNMSIQRYIDPADVAAKVAIMLSVEDGISQNEAIVRFMRSKTFQELTASAEMCEMPPSEILSIYRRECD